MSRIWHRLASWPRGRLIAVGIFLFLGLVYWGYCWGWWGRTNLVLQYLFQCRCPAASEEVRYRPFTVLASACRQSDARTMSPSGRWLVIQEERPVHQLWLLDLVTGQRDLLPVSLTRTTIVQRVDYISEHTLFLGSSDQGPRRYRLLDQPTGALVEVPRRVITSRDTLQPAELADVTRAVVLSDHILLLAAEPFTHPDQNRVLTAQNPTLYTRTLATLETAGIPRDTPRYPFHLVEYSPDKYSPSRRWLATPTGIYRAAEEHPVLPLTFPTIATPFGTDDIFVPYGWTPAEHAVVYRGRLHYLHDARANPAFGFAVFPVPQPVLLVEVPEEYRE